MSAPWIVFADDWGRHPSSAQHVVRHLLVRQPVLWVNTVGSRRVSLNWQDLSRATQVVRRWLAPRRETVDWEVKQAENLRVISPLMYPGYRTRWQRRFNRDRVARAVRQRMAKLAPTSRTADWAITTLPTTADLLGQLPVRRWCYYCVDDFSVWPGLDGSVMADMEKQLVQQAQLIVCAGRTLQQRMQQMGRGDAHLLTHGVDLEHFRQRDTVPMNHRGDGDYLLFWGLIDERLDEGWLQTLRERLPMGTRVVLAGPNQGRWPEVLKDKPFELVGPVKYEDLPGLASRAKGLIMPYGDLPVTQAMQPLKLLEYLAVGWREQMKPVLVRKLPATQEWSQACDVCADAEDFALKCVERIAGGLPPAQAAVRQQRLPGESWQAKAEQFWQWLSRGWK